MPMQPIGARNIFWGWHINGLHCRHFHHAQKTTSISYLLDKVSDTLGSTSNLLTGVIELFKSSAPGNDLLATSVRHPVILKFILKDADNDRVGDGSADVRGSDCVQAFVLGDVVLEEEGVGLWWVVVSLNAVGLLEGVVVLVPDHLGLGYAEDGALDLAAVDPDEVDLGGGLDEF